jgi:3-hydroxyisobutyrate dehydrogenase-like beta-hydroxyacid dehydrogenase
MQHRIGVVGTGLMGFPIICNLFNDGFGVIGYDISPKAIESLKEKNIPVADNPRELACNSDVIISVLNECSQLRGMLEGKEGLLSGVESKGESVIIDFSTSDPEESVPLGKYLATKKITYIDCGMTGGRAGAVGRKLVFMAGGNKDIFEKYKYILEKLAKSITYIGPSGCGHTMKLIHNAVSHSTFLAVMEATVLGKKLGMDIAAMIEIFNIGNERSYATEVRFPKHILSGTYDMGYAYKSGYKDMKLIMKGAEKMQFNMPIGAATFDYWKYAMDIGKPDEDVTTMFKLLEIKNAK